MSKNKSSYHKGQTPYQIDSEVIPFFLIVCEGERTEPNYFKEFRVPAKHIEVKGLGYNTDTLVKEAIRLKDEGNYNQDDQVWAVFDRDSFPAENFNNAIALAKSHNIRVAYSNEAFELWYILHYEYLHTGISRKRYCEKLTTSMGREYKKKDPNIYRYS